MLKCSELGGGLSAALAPLHLLCKTADIISSPQANTSICQAEIYVTAATALQNFHRQKPTVQMEK